MKKRTKLLIAALAGTMISAAQAAPFGGPEDTEYASRLWQSLMAAKLAGSDAIQSHAYTGQHPHGAILQTMQSMATVGSDTGVVIVKRNYGGEGVSKESVSNDPDKYLKAVTVMFKRKGYDPDNQDWFWVKYKPDGSLHTNPKGMSLAGRVAKIKPPKGCIACHAAAPGGDYVFIHNRLAQ